jgi:large subunit ribosomal protein L5e
MGFVKVIKNKAYYKRFQVQYRRRREGKTDYQARRALIIQDKNKYNSPKYRFVVRITNTDVITQITYAKITGDIVLTSAYSHELPNFGLNVGLSNKPASYATGFLAARRHLTKLGLATKYVGNQKIDGSDYNVEAIADGPRPFLAILDIGLARTTTGARIFLVLKGALDGGLNIPHSEKRFFGYNNETKKLDAAALRKTIFGGHIADYMRKLADENPTKYQRQFSSYHKAKVTPDALEALYKKVHAAIRANPVAKKSEKKAPETHFKTKGRKKQTLADRKNRIKQKIDAHKKKIEAGHTTE